MPADRTGPQRLGEPRPQQGTPGALGGVTGPVLTLARVVLVSAAVRVLHGVQLGGTAVARVSADLADLVGCLEPEVGVALRHPATIPGLQVPPTGPVDPAARLHPLVPAGLDELSVRRRARQLAKQQVGVRPRSG